jgi:hypothetical protein
MADGASAILEQLLAERGGKAKFDVAALAAARALAQVLASDDPSPRAISNLIELLPPKASRAGDALDLRLLTDKELDHFEYLVKRATGVEAERPQRPKYSERERDALELAQLIDGIEARSTEVERATPTAAELQAIKNLRVGLSGFVVNLARIWAQSAGLLPAAPAAREITSEVPAAPVEAPAAEAAPAPPPANVVPLRPPPSPPGYPPADWTAAGHYGPRDWPYPR